MRKLALGIAVFVAIAGCADARNHLPRGIRPIANPSAIVATEYDFAREAQEKGQWTAFRDYAADDAVMFVPQAVSAKEWLRNKTDPAQAVSWQPSSVWMSCDGTMAVSKGAWQRPDGSKGYFTTVWRRQKNGDYKWTLDQGDTLAQPLAEPEMISGEVADCSRANPPTIPSPPSGVDQRMGWSDDKTLQWIVQVKLDGSRDFRVHRWNGTGYEEALRSEVAAK